MDRAAARRPGVRGATGGALAVAKERGEITPELAAAFHDRAVAFARNYELAVIALIIVLMVTKPFLRILPAARWSSSHVAWDGTYEAP